MSEVFKSHLFSRCTDYCFRVFAHNFPIFIPTFLLPCYCHFGFGLDSSIACRLNVSKSNWFWTSTNICFNLPIKWLRLSFLIRQKRLLRQGKFEIKNFIWKFWRLQSNFGIFWSKHSNWSTHGLGFVNFLNFNSKRSS